MGCEYCFRTAEVGHVWRTRIRFGIGVISTVCNVVESKIGPPGPWVRTCIWTSGQRDRHVPYVEWTSELIDSKIDMLIDLLCTSLECNIMFANK
jgi:hypothetical protein